jgi:hypothetical protein
MTTSENSEKTSSNSWDQNASDVGLLIVERFRLIMCTVVAGLSAASMATGELSTTT